MTGRVTFSITAHAYDAGLSPRSSNVPVEEAWEGPVKVTRHGRGQALHYDVTIAQAKQMLSHALDLAETFTMDGLDSDALADARALQDAGVRIESALKAAGAW